MKVTYLYHSGFLLETEAASYIFDYYKGEIPPVDPGKPLYVFASHVHGDHFTEKIFTHPVTARAEAFFLSYDIARRVKQLRRMRELPGVDRIVWCRLSEPLEQGGLRITCLKSTDEGVAFLLEEMTTGQRYYHAGDLNWWHWEGESRAWNRNMEVNYKREIDRIAGTHFRAAFVPLDPRLEAAYDRGLAYFLEKCRADVVFPMHMWEQYEVIDRFAKEHPEHRVVLTEGLPEQTEEGTGAGPESDAVLLAGITAPGQVFLPGDPGADPV